MTRKGLVDAVDRARGDDRCRTRVLALVLIAMVVLAQLPIGPSVGAAAVVVILGSDGVALTAAAGVLLTATGTVGALAFAAWAGLDLLSRFRGGGRAPVVEPPAAAARP